jgi:putative ABC transport system permease protein
MPDSAKLYSWLLRLYPARFREEYQAEMERQFRDEYREARGSAERVRMWVHAVRDLATSVPGEAVRELSRDLKYSIRLYRGRAGNAAFAVIALGLAIGASTGVFSVLNALLVRSLPFSEPDELVELWRSPVSATSGRAAFSEWRSQSSYLQDAAAISTSEMNLAGKRDALRVKVAETSANFFQLLGTRSLVGRTFAQDEDAPGRTSVAVISHSLWMQLFGGDPAVAGTALNVNGSPLTIIGVAQPRFDYPGNVSIWVPSVFDFERVPKQGAFFFQTIGRLKPGLTLGHARSLFEAEVGRVASESLRADEVNRARITSLRDELAGPVGQAGWILAGLILLVLLAACANVAQLLLSRISERRQELAIRAALGASRARLVQQLITEGMALTLTGATLGLVIAHWTAQVATSVAAAQLATQSYTVLDWRVIGFAATLALLTGIVFGVLPAFLAGRLQPSGDTMRTKAASPEIGTKRVRASLIALQVGLTFTLLASSIAMGRTFLQLLRADLGLRPANVLTVSVSLQGTKYRSGASRWQYYSEVLNRLRGVQGVEAAGAVGFLPLANNTYMVNAFKLDSGQVVRQIVTNAVTPDYFRAQGTAFLAGRDFRPGEHRTEPAVIVNEAFARDAGLGTAIVGRRITAHWSKTPYTVVGLVATTRLAGPAYPGGPQIYWPIEEEPPPTLTFVAKVQGDAEALLATCAQAIRDVEREVPVYDVRTLEQRLAEVLARPRFYTTAIIFLAGLATLLAAVGTYGAAAYSVAQRKHEMGIRMALGASYPRVRAMVVRESLAPISYGVAAGIIGAIASGQYLEHLIVRAQPIDLATCLTGAAFLLLGGFVAAWSATTRVLAIAPAEALRAE